MRVKMILCLWGVDMYINCPECEHKNEVDGDDLPDCACDDKDFECSNCEHVFNIGWYATVELR